MKISGVRPWLWTALSLVVLLFVGFGYYRLKVSQVPAKAQSSDEMERLRLAMAKNEDFRKRAAGQSSGAKSFKICNTDRLRITFTGEEELTTIVRVDARGRVNLKYLGDIVLAGMTISEAERSVETRYRESRYLKNPQVTISVVEYAPREVSIQGEVRNPGRYPLPIGAVMTVSDLVALAGGLSDTARASSVKVTRFTPDGQVAGVFVVNVESVIQDMKSGRAGDTVLQLEPGDVVYVPQRII